MKVEVKQERLVPVFHPVTVTITLEKPEEYFAFLDLTGKSITVTEAVRALDDVDCSKWDHLLLISMLSVLYRKLIGKGEA